jgi:hypothetical protein
MSPAVGRTTVELSKDAPHERYHSPPVMDTPVMGERFAGRGVPRIPINEPVSSYQ